jgi:hypothetical protein
VQLLSLAECHRHLRNSTLEVHLERDQREPLALDGANQLADLLSVHEQLARARRLMVEAVPLLVRRDVQIEQEHFAVVQNPVTIGEVCLSVAERLHLGPREHDAGLPRIDDLIVVTGALVSGNDLMPVLLIGCGHGTLWKGLMAGRAVTGRARIPPFAT